MQREVYAMVMDDIVGQMKKDNTNIIFNCYYHMDFCPKYRYKVFVNAIDGRLKQIIT